ncbi:g protein-coupled receptor [Zymoseptoria brevis]|uniref:G protein-coupled receptor n=1 Tax=Zymoseptoria brevis TaxID=1047168 RepID=A0A0F4GTL3_9PEZI|nr:g protein-coupled receptor [Zymoseptoria brevis]
MVPSLNDCDDCLPSYLRRRSLDSVPASTIAWSLLPLVLTWVAVFAVAQRRLFPVLSGDGEEQENGRGELPQHQVKSGSVSWKEKVKNPSAQRVASWVFSTSIGLSAVLVELLLCEISNTLNPAARGLALRTTLSSLLILSVVIIPALEIHGVVKGTLGGSKESTSTKRGKSSYIRLSLEMALFAAWILFFWYIPQASILRKSLHEGGRGHDESKHPFSEACLERIGIIGISLMASLSGFAAVSSLWQTFGVRHRTVKESDISRKASGLQATQDMLAAKASRVRALERKMSESASQTEQAGFMGRMMGGFRGSKEATELQSLRMELSGLETMSFTLSNTLMSTRARYVEQQRSKTSWGRILNVVNMGFAIYCAYRIIATSISSLRRLTQPGYTTATTDPINNFLALVTTHWDSNLDREAWSRQISFLLSGVMLLASFNAVLQTFRVFARFAPNLLQHAQTSLPLVISQIAGTYVISSALLLRSNLPAEVSSVITEALGAPLEGGFVMGWFESWFLVAVGLTATGILVGRKVSGGDDDWDDDGSMEMGKRH